MSQHAPDVSSHNPPELPAPVKMYRERLDELKSHADRNLRRTLGWTAAIVVGVSLLFWAGLYVVLSNQIDNHLNGHRVNDALTGFEADARAAAERIDRTAAESESRIASAIASLDTRADAFTERGDALIEQLTQSAGDARRGYRYEIEKFYWSEGKPPVKMIHKDEGVCVIYHIAGNFKGRGEAVWVEVQDDGYWWIRAHSQQPLGIGVMAIKIIPIDTPEPAATSSLP